MFLGRSLSTRLLLRRQQLQHKFFPGTPSVRQARGPPIAAERAITTERGGMRTERRRNFLRKSEFRATLYPIARPNPRFAGRQAAGRKERGFFYFFRRNPLKSPDFGRIKPSKSKHFYLDVLGFAWRYLARVDGSAGQDRCAHQRLVDRRRALTPLADRPDDQRLAAPHVAAGIDLRRARRRSG